MRRRVLLLLLSGLLLAASESRAVDFATPIKYTALLMSVEIATIWAFDMSDNSFKHENFERAWTDPKPEKDDDNDFINYVLHPLMGSETYLRAREGDFGVPGSIAFSMAASVTWEYLVESWVEVPSTQDLIFTTGIGWILGEFRYQIKQSNNEKGRSNLWIDPIWTVLEHLDFRLTKKNRDTMTTVGFTFAL